MCKQYIRTVNRYQEKYKTAKDEGQNEVKLSQLRNDRKNAIMQALSEQTGGAGGWLGTLTRLQTGGDGAASLQVTMACALPIMLSNTGALIPRESPLYARLANFDKGKKVLFSGRFFPGEQDALAELSFTEGGSMTSPEFRFEFTEIAAAR